MRKAYPSDLSDDQWALIEPLIPTNTTGRPRKVDMREVFNAILYINRSGCQWDMLPHDFPAKSTVYDHFAQWRDDGTWQEMMDALRRQVRQAAGREPEPRTACIDSQTVKGTEVGGERGYDGGKKIRGVKRHIVVDSLGLLLVVMITAASLDDGTGAPGVLGRLTAAHQSRLEAVRGDTKYRNHALDAWLEAMARAVRGRGDRATAGLGGLREAAEALGRGADVRLDRPVPAEQSRLRVAPALGRGIHQDRFDSSHAQAFAS